VTARATLGWIAAAILCLLAVWVDGVATGGRPILPERPLPTPDTPPLLAATPDAVAGLEWTSDAGRLTLVRTPDGWHDAAGHRRPGDVVDAVLESLASLHPHAVQEGRSTNLAEYGLKPARERLVLSDDSGRTLLAMDVGIRNPAWTGYYARRDGSDEVLLVGALLRRELDKLRSVRDDSVPP
jgi:hypothetical protein